MLVILALLFHFLGFHALSTYCNLWHLCYSSPKLLPHAQNRYIGMWNIDLTFSEILLYQMISQCHDVIHVITEFCIFGAVAEVTDGFRIALSVVETGLGWMTGHQVMAWLRAIFLATTSTPAIRFIQLPVHLTLGSSLMQGKAVAAWNWIIFSIRECMVPYLHFLFLHSAV